MEAALLTTNRKSKKPVGGILHWGKRFEHPYRKHGNMKITDIEVPFFYPGVLRSRAKELIADVIYSKVKSHETYMVKNVDFDHKIVEVVKYEF